MKIGTILIATSPCILKGTKRQCLSVGKPYAITAINSLELQVIDDEGDKHTFDIKEGKDGWKKFFTLQEDYSIH